jgi:hypothetical protein
VSTSQPSSLRPLQFAHPFSQAPSAHRPPMQRDAACVLAHGVHVGLAHPVAGDDVAAHAPAHSFVPGGQEAALASIPDAASCIASAPKSPEIDSADGASSEHAAIADASTATPTAPRSRCHAAPVPTATR